MVFCNENFINHIELVDRKIELNFQPPCRIPIKNNPASNAPNTVFRIEQSISIRKSRQKTYPIVCIMNFYFLPLPLKLKSNILCGAMFFHVNQQLLKNMLKLIFCVVA